MAFMGSPNEAAIKALLGQLFMSGMQPTTDLQNMDIMRLQEQLMRSNRNIEDLDNRIREEERMSRERERERRERGLRDDFDNSDGRGPHRSNFFGGALDRSERNMPSELSWQQQGRWSSSSESFRDDDKVDERRLSRERTSRFDDIGSERRVGGPVDMAASFRPGLPLPMSLQDLVSRGPNILSDQLANLQHYMHGMNNKPLKPPYTVEPRQANQPQPSLSEKPLGCHTIFVGSLPDNITEDILRDVFSQCGTIETVRISVGKGGKKFAHLRFIKADSVDIAVSYSGYKLFVGNGEERSGGRLHIDYAKSREDEKEYELMIRAKEREARHMKDNMEKPVLLFSESAASELVQTIRSCSGFHESFNTVAQWLERGECTRKTSSTFYSLLCAVHNHIKRLVKEKKEHEEIVKKQKQEQEERAKLIMAQGSAIMKIFKAASKKKCWDHFSKAQRRNIDEWHQQVEKEIKISEEEQMGKREEVGMDLEEEESQTTSESSQPVKEDDTEPAAKKQKLEDSEETNDSQTETQTKQESQESKESQQLQESHEAQDLRLRAQSESLRALAEKNASLMWEVEGYKTEIVDLKQKFAHVFQDKDLQIARLMTAVQGLQSFLQNISLNAPEVYAGNIEVEVVKDSSDVYDPTAPTANEPTEQTTTETSEQQNDQQLDEQRPQQKKEKLTETPERQPEKSDEKKSKSEVKKGMRTRKRGRKKEKEVAEELETSGQLSQDSKSTDTETADKSSVVKDSVTPSSVTAPSLTDDVTTPADANVTENPSDPNGAYPNGVIRLSSLDMTVVGLLCSYLQVCPYGATSEQVLYHIQRQVPGVTAEDLERVLNGLPMIFKGDGLEFLNKTWKFKQVLS